MNTVGRHGSERARPEYAFFAVMGEVSVMSVDL
jgi:hypothetical protein